MSLRERSKRAGSRVLSAVRVSLNPNMLVEAHKGPRAAHRDTARYTRMGGDRVKRAVLFLLACVAFVGIVVLVRSNRGPGLTPESEPSQRYEPAEEPAVPMASDRLTASETHALPEVLVDPHVVVEKDRRALTVYSSDEPIKVYRIALGREPVGDKEVEGDGKTPEGDFYLCTKNPASQYHRALGLSYPDAEDAARGLAEGLISTREHRQIVEAIRRYAQPPWKTALGGEIMIHGAGATTDWTAGCIALDDSEVEELFDALPLGTPVTILP